MSRMYRPLADRLRPTALSDVVGQREILEEGGVLRRLIESKNIPNLIFFGPSGTGKTTVASIIASETKRSLYKLNATTASVNDIRDIIAELDTLLAPNGVLLYLDEIQYFNKKQQQSLLEFIENGKITLIASTTENPYFYVYNAILSRSVVFEFQPLLKEDVEAALFRILQKLSQEEGNITPEEGVIPHLALACGGDVRKAIGALEVLVSTGVRTKDALILRLSDAEKVADRSAFRFDRDGDSHFDVMSAFQKSIRGSDPDAAVHYLARMLSGGDLQSACRRLIVTAAEDIGLAYPQAMPVVMACVQAALQVGLPEAQIPLAEAVLLLANAPKSNSGVKAISRAMADVKSGKAGEVPKHLKDSHYKGAEKLGRGIGYKYPHDFEGSYTGQQYLPDELLGVTYYEPGDNKTERAFTQYWEERGRKNRRKTASPGE